MVNKFIKTSLIFLLPILLFLIGFELLLRRIPNDYTLKRNYMDEHSKNIEVLVLGSSHSYYGINPSYFSQHAFNAAYISQSLDLDLAILKRYENKWDNLKYIILPVDYFSLFTRLEDGVENWRLKNYKIYYGIQNESGLWDNLEIFNGKFSLNVAKAKAFFFDKVILHSLSNENGFGQVTFNVDHKTLAASGRSAAKRHTTTLSHNKYFDENLKTVEAILQFAEAHKAELILITSPAYKSYVAHLNPKQLLKTTHSISQLAKNRARYYNFINDSTFTAQDFYDADHLNDKGAKKFTIKLDSLLHIK